MSNGLHIEYLRPITRLTDTIDAQIDNLSFISAVSMRENAASEAAYIEENFDGVYAALSARNKPFTLELNFTSLFMNAINGGLFVGAGSKLHNSETVYGFRRSHDGQVSYQAIANTSGNVTRLLTEGEMQAWRGASILKLAKTVLNGDVIKSGSR